jgi:hypothetical protein
MIHLEMSSIGDKSLFRLLTPGRRILNECYRVHSREHIVNSVNSAKPILLAFSLFCAGNAIAQEVEKEPTAIVELGGATDWSITEGGSSFGPTVAVEVTPIENWLELEAGVTPLFRRHSTGWDIDLLFKKPWTLSKKADSTAIWPGFVFFLFSRCQGLRSLAAMRAARKVAGYPSD